MTMAKKPSLAPGETMTGHPLAFSVMRLCGVDPVAATSGTATWPADHVPDYVENDGGVLRMRMPLDGSRGAMLTFNGGEARLSARGQTMGMTALACIRDMPLSQIVDHVLMTGSRCLVTGAETFDPAEDGIGTHFVIGGGAMEFTAP